MYLVVSHANPFYSYVGESVGKIGEETKAKTQSIKYGVTTELVMDFVCTLVGRVLAGSWQLAAGPEWAFCT